MSKSHFPEPEVENQLTSIDQVDSVVCADAHVAPTLDAILPYVDDQYREFKQWAEKAASAGLELNPGSTPSPIYQYEHEKAEQERDAYFLSDLHGAEDLYDMMDELGIDKAVANDLGLTPLKKPKYLPGYVNGRNNWLIEQFDRYDEIVGNITISTNGAIDEMAEEIHRHGDENSVVGIQWFGHIYPLPGSSKYEPIYEAATEHDLPISIHTGTGNRGWPNQFWWSQTYAEDHVYEHPFSHQVNIASMVLNGLFERFPDLTVVNQESGLGHLPYLIQRMDDVYRNMPHEFPQIDKLPSKYVDSNMYFGTQPLGHTSYQKNQIAWTAEMVGPENIMWSSDAPHPDFDTPEELFTRINHRYSAETINQIMGGNAKEVFGI
jgi:predicted TIM-barrel fold metal-dependent hydrolase